MAFYQPRGGKNRWEYVEYVGNAAPSPTPEESFGPDDNRATKVIDWYNAWGSRQELVKDILGWTERAADGKIHRYDGMPHPDFWSGVADISTMYATRILSGVGIGSPDDKQMWQIGQAGGLKTSRLKIYRTKIQFESLLYDVAGGLTLGDESNWHRYVVKEYQPSGTTITAPKGLFKFVGGPPASDGQDPAQFGVSIGRTLPFTEVKITQKHLPTNCVPSSTINPTAYPNASTDFAQAGPLELGLGKINEFGFNGYTAGQLLYLACALKPVKSWYINSGGTKIWDVTTSYAFNPNGWPFVPFLASVAPATLGWVEVTADGATNLMAKAPGKSTYDWYNMAKLYRAPG